MTFDWRNKSSSDVKILGYILHNCLSQMVNRFSSEEWGNRFGDVRTPTPVDISRATNIDQEEVELFLCELESKELIKATS